MTEFRNGDKLRFELRFVDSYPVKSSQGPYYYIGPLPDSEYHVIVRVDRAEDFEDPEYVSDHVLERNYSRWVEPVEAGQEYESDTGRTFVVNEVYEGMVFGRVKDMDARGDDGGAHWHGTEYTVAYLQSVIWKLVDHNE